MKRWYLAVLASYLAFIVANLLDIASSLGNAEMNPLMQTSELNPLFSLKKAIAVKFIFLCYYIVQSVAICYPVSFVSRRVACLIAMAIPMPTTYLLIQVALNNVLG